MKIVGDARRLPAVEVVIYLMVGLYSICYICYNVFRDSRQLHSQLNPEDFAPGWNILPYPKDISNFEWSFWFSYFWKCLPWFVGYILVGLVLQLFNIHRQRKHVLMFFSIVCLSYLLGVKIMTFYVVHASIAFLSSSFRSKVLVWVTCFGLLTTLNLEYFNTNCMYYVYDGGDDLDGKNYYLFIFCLALLNLRYISFCLEKCDSQTERGYGFLDLIIYLFYLPLFFTGPILTYDLFSTQIDRGPKPWTADKILSTTFKTLRILFWATFIEFVLHFLYFDAIHQKSHLLHRISLWSLVGIIYCEGQFFMVKYLVMYELPGQIASFDDVTTPKGPKCISYIYRYSHLWKSFDRGFYNFLKRYIYIPFGGSKHGLFRQLLGSGMCFFFIYVWHGGEYYLLQWCLLNYTGCTIEVIGDWLVGTKTAKRYLDLLGFNNTRRLNGILSVPLYLMSTMGIFMFFNGSRVGRIFFNRIILDTTWPVFILFVSILYCNIQNAIFIQSWIKGKKNSNM